MLKLNPPPQLVARINTQAGESFVMRGESAKRRRRVQARIHDQVLAHPPAGPPGFETEDGAKAENRIRVKGLRLSRPTTGRMAWTNIGSRLRLVQQLPFPLVFPPRDVEGYDRLLRKLESKAAERGVRATSLASSLTMRGIRQAVLRELLSAFEDLPVDQIATVTVINGRWTCTAATLDAVTAKQIKNRFRTDLNRIGLTTMPGPFIAFLHGEFEPRSGTYVLHYHILTTWEKARALHRLKQLSGYHATPSGAAPILIKRVRDRHRQFSYLLKGFWPSRTIRRINGVDRRDRQVHRIPEPFASQVLLWLDRQRLRDLTIMNQCWSQRKGGTEPMRRLYLSVFGPW